MASRSTFRIIAGIALMSAASVWQIATGFTPSKSLGSIHPQQQHQATSTSSVRRAYIYYPDDGHMYDDAGQEDVFDSFGTTLSNSPILSIHSNSPFGQLAGQLSTDPAITSALARLASAFSPPGFAIDLANVNNVRCHCVDNRHLEIEAVVCDQMDCSSLLVPVDFPEVCNVDDALQECIIRNVHHLDATGGHVIQEREQVFAEEEEAQRAMEALQSLDSGYLKSTSVSLPYWWVPPTSVDDDYECDLIEQLLNGDDFRGMVQELATHVLYMSNDLGEGGMVRSAKIKAVGPVGIVLMVQLSLHGKTYEEDGGLFNETLMDVPIKFSDMLPGGIDEQRGIREQVLMMVSSVSAA